jgi:DNA-binding response OmpR family regulator
MLPKKNGFEVCQELRQTPNGKNTPILITTAVYRGRKYRSQALHVHGASEYIEKPIADDQLVAIVRRFLQGSTKRPARTDEAAAPLRSRVRNGMQTSGGALRSGAGRTGKAAAVPRRQRRLRHAAKPASVPTPAMVAPAMAATTSSHRTDQRALVPNVLRRLWSPATPCR